MGVADRTVLVTGVSSGVGRTTAKTLVKKGATVIGVARRENLLQELAEELSAYPGKFIHKTVDIGKEEEIVALFSWIEENDKKIDVLINNAGVFNFATLTGGKTEEWKVILDTLVVGYSIFAREAIKTMKKHQTNGLIINILSVAAKSVPAMGAYMYTASQHALDALGTGLRHEITQQQLPIRVSKICPALIKTEKVLKDAELIKLPSIEMEDVANTVIYILDSPNHLEVNEVVLRPMGMSM